MLQFVDGSMPVRHSTALLAWAPLGALLFSTFASVPARATDEAAEGDEAFWVDTRGIILPVAADGELDMVRLGELRQAFDGGIEHLREARWEEAAVALEGVAAELPVPDVLVPAAVARFQQERYARAQAHLELSLAADPSDVRANNLMGLVLSAQGKALDARPYLEACRAQAEATGNASFEAYAMLNLAQVELDLGNPELAGELADGALSIGRNERFGNVTAAALNTRGNVALYHGRYKDAEKLYRRSLGIERRGRGNRDQGAVLNNMATVLAARGELAEARTLLLQAVEEAREGGNRTQEAGILVSLAGLEHQLGQQDAMRAHLDEAVAIYRDLDLQRGMVEVRLQEARLARDEQRWTEAMDAVELARIALRDLSLPHMVAEVELLECELLLDRADPHAARAPAERSRAWYEEASQPVQAASAELCWAEATAAVGESQEAAAAYRRVIAALEASGAEIRLADARQRYGLFLVAHGEVEAGRETIAAATEWLRDEGRHEDCAQIANAEGCALGDAGALEPALAAFEASERAASAAERADLEQAARTNRVSILVRLGRLDEAEQLAGPSPDPELLETIALARGRRSFEAGLAAMEQQRYDEALARMEEVVAVVPAGDRTMLPATHANLRMIEHHLGLLQLEQGDHDGATRHLERALEHVSYEEDRGAEARLLKDLAVIRTDLEDTDRALFYLDQALPAAREAGDDALVRAVRFQTGLVTMDTDPERSRAELEAVVADPAAPADELAAAGHFNLGIVLFRMDDYEASRASLTRARALYQTLGDQARVAMIDEYLADFDEGIDP